VLGDHEPARFVSGVDGFDVPVHVIGPPDLVARFAALGWTEGMLPRPANCPPCRMDRMRDLCCGRSSWPHHEAGRAPWADTGVLALVLWLAQPKAVLAALRGVQPGWLARILRSRSLGWQGATASVLIERLAGQVALGLVALASLGLWLGAKGLALGALGAAGRAGGPVGCAALAQSVWAGLAGPRVWGRQLGLTVAILAANLGGFWAAAHSVGVVLDPVAAVALVPLTLLAMLIPLTINGWGVREGIAAALWPLGA
jgi:hypothetical protein